MISIKVALFLLYLIARFKKSHGLSTEHIRFSEIPDLRGKICLEAHTVLAQRAGSAIKCAQLCTSLSDEECKVASFEMTSATCYGCGTTDRNQMTDASSLSYMRDEPTLYGYLVTAADGIPDDQLSASSVLSHTTSHSPDRARLGTVYTGVAIGGWAPSSTDDAPFIEADFARTRYIVGIATQGRYDDGYVQYVTSYTLAVSLECVYFKMIQNDNFEDVVFRGNSDSGTVVTNMLDSPVIARCIRIYPIESYNGVCLRFDILGI